MSILNNKIDDLRKLKQQFKKLEDNMKKLQDFILDQLATMSPGTSPQRNDCEEDAMFTKKPLLGMSCASCDKDIVNLNGKQADFYAWNKMPFRDPTERISRVGQGFSRMLANVKPDIL